VVRCDDPEPEAEEQPDCQDPANPYDHYYESDDPDEVGYYDSAGRLRRR